MSLDKYLPTDNISIAAMFSVKKDNWTGLSYLPTEKNNLDENVFEIIDIQVENNE